MDKVSVAIRPATRSVFRTAGRMKSLLGEMEAWRRQLKMLKANNCHELIKANKVRNYIDVIEMVFGSSLRREETRGMNIRLDYPYRDDLDWMKHSVLKRGPAGPRVDFVPVPVYRYPVKPDRYQRTPTAIPWPKLSEDALGDKNV